MLPLIHRSSKTFLIRRVSKASPAPSKVTVVILKSASFGASLNERHEQHVNPMGGTQDSDSGAGCIGDALSKRDRLGRERIVRR